jgi:hypothetical protein
MGDRAGPLEEAEHFWMEDKKEVRTHQRQQVWKSHQQDVMLLAQIGLVMLVILVI